MAGSDFLDSVKGVTAEFERQKALRDEIAFAAALAGAKDEASAKAVADAVLKRAAAEEKAAAAAQRAAAAEEKAASAAKEKAAADEKAAAAATQKAAAEKEAAAAADKAKKKLEELTKNAQDTGDAADKMSSRFSASSVAIAAAAAGAVLLVSGIKSAYEATVAFMEEWGTAGIKLGIEQTGKHELQKKLIQQLGGDADQAIKVGVKLGDEDTAVARYKELLEAKFSKEEIPVLVRLAAGGNAIKEGAGDAFVKELEKLKLEPKVKSKDLDALWKLGISSKDAYARLAKMLGTDVPTAMAKVKAGTVDTEKVIAAVKASASKSFGEAAKAIEDSLLTKLARGKADLLHLFDDLPTGKLKGALDSAIASLEGGAGADLKAAIGDLFGAAFETAFGDFAGGKGKATIDDTFHAIAHGVREAANEVRALKPEVQALLAMFKQAMHDGTIQNLIAAGKAAAKVKMGQVQDEAGSLKAKAKFASQPWWKSAGQIWTDPLGELDDVMGLGIKRRLGLETLSPGRAIMRGFGFDPFRDNEEHAMTEQKGSAAAGKAGAAAMDVMNTSALDTGAALPAGMAEGIEANDGVAVAAAEAMGEKVLAALKAKMQVHSPSEATGEIGDYSAEGFADRMENHPGPARAAARMGANALGGLAGSGLAQMAGTGAAAGGGAAAGAGGGAITFAPVISGGTHAEENKKMLTALFVNEFLPMLRRSQRDGVAGARS